MNRDSSGPSGDGDRPFWPEGDSLVVRRDQDIDLPRKCIRCCAEDFLDRSTFRIRYARKSFERPKAAVSYYRCRKHSWDARVNGYLLMLWPAAGIGLYYGGIHPIMAFFLSALPIFLLMGVVSRSLKLRRYEDGEFYLGGFSSEFLATLSSDRAAEPSDGSDAATPSEGDAIDSQ